MIFSSIIFSVFVKSSMYVLGLAIALSHHAFLLGQSKNASRYAPHVKAFCSADSRYFAVNYASEKYNVQGDVFSENVIKVYHVKSRKYISQLRFQTGLVPEKVFFSPNNKKIVVKDSKDYLVFDIASRKLEKEFEQVHTLGFTQGDQQALVAERTVIHCYDWMSKKNLTTFRGVSEKESILEVHESPIHEWIIAKTDQQRYYFWKKHNEKVFKVLDGFDLKFSADGSVFHVLSYQKNRCVLTSFMTASLQPFQSFDSESYLPFSVYNFSKGSSLSPEGKYVAFCAKRFGTTISIGIFDIFTQKLVYQIDTAKIKHPLNEELDQPYTWIDDHTIRLHLKDEVRIEKTYSQNIPIFKRIVIKKEALYYLSNDSLTQLLLNHQYPEYMTSEDALWIASWLPSSRNRKNTVVALQASFGQHRPIFLDNVNALCFSPDSRLFFIEKLKNEQRIHAFIFTKDFLHPAPKSYEFATKPFKGGKEETIEEDAIPPDDYEYFFLRRVKSYDSAASARFVFKSLTTRDSNAYLSFHWLDSAGNFYSHLTETDFRRLICELTLTDESGQKIPINAWQLSEHHPNEQLAIALVLDHSGSMGEARAVLLQQGVEALLRNKRPQDSIALIRYDNRAEVFSDLTHHLSNLLSKNPINGLRGFGGGTALLDATHAGIMTLAKDAFKKKRLLVLFTDGMENSSWLTKEEVIQDALRYGVSIHTVGFGEQIDETLLRLLAEATQGTYYRIFQSNFLTDILTDIYQKINHFYTISLPIPSSGNYLLRVKFCHEKQKTFETTLQHYRPELVDSDDLSSFYLGELEEPSEKEENDFKQIDEKEVVYFRFDFHRIESQDEEKIERIALLLKENPHLRVALYGHTDNVGSDAYNNQLSWRRANEVKQRLLQLGIESHRIETKGLGASLPITSNETEEGRAKNRRTEIVIIRQ